VRRKLKLELFAIVGDLFSAPEIDGVHTGRYAAFFEIEAESVVLVVTPIDCQQTDSGFELLDIFCRQFA
jgi:hypothetical protein